MTARAEQQWIDVNGISIRFARSGPGTPQLVLIHEMGGSLESWNGVVAALPDTLGILRYDMRGFGHSEKIRGEAAMADMVEDLRQLLDALGVAEPVAIAGCAVGAAVALSFALAHPERTARILAMAPATGIAPDRRDHAEAYIARLTGGGLRELVDGGLERTFPPRFRTDADAFAAARGRLLANDPDSYAAVYRMLTTLSLEDEIAAIACPVTFAAGTLDTARPPERVAPLAERVADGRMVVIETGHAMAVLTPAPVAQAILDFLALALRDGKLKSGCEKLV